MAAGGRLELSLFWAGRPRFRPRDSHNAALADLKHFHSRHSRDRSQSAVHSPLASSALAQALPSFLRRSRLIARRQLSGVPSSAGKLFHCFGRTRVTSTMSCCPRTGTSHSADSGAEGRMERSEVKGSEGFSGSPGKSTHQSRGVEGKFLHQKTQPATDRPRPSANQQRT